MTNLKIRVNLESFNYELLNSSCNKIVNLVKNIQINSINTIRLPTKKKIYCVLRSPHVDKDSREHFEIRTHKRILEIHYGSDINSSFLFNLLLKADLPCGVFFKLALSN